VPGLEGPHEDDDDTAGILAALEDGTLTCAEDRPGPAVVELT